MVHILPMLLNCIDKIRCCCKKSTQVISDEDETKNESILQLKTLRRRINAFDIDLTSTHNEDITLVWLDQQIDTDVENTDQMNDLLEKLNESVLMFSTKEAFMECLQTMTNGTIFLILSGQYANEILPLLSDYQRIQLSYIFCIEEKNYEDLMKRYSKLRGIFIDPENLIKQIKKDIHFYIEQLIKLKSFDKNEQKSIIDLSKESAEFIWFYALKIALTSCDKSEHTKQIMLAYCRSEYQGNRKILEQIDNFEQNYKSEDAIEWYTKDSFLYKLINKSLRTENTQALMKLTYFITDLSNALKTEWQNTYHQQKQDSIKVYHGAHLTDDEINKLHPGVLISLNGYLSTSSSLETAGVYVRNVVFEIDINPSMEDIVFASIAQYSQFPEEEEVLFDLGCIFQITQIDHNSDENRYIIKMNGVNEGDKLAMNYFKTMKNKVKNRGHLDGLVGDFVHKLSFEKGLRLYEYLLTISSESVNQLLNNCSRFFKLYEYCSDPLNVAIFYGCFGWFFLQRSEYDLAIDYSKRAFTLMDESSSDDRNDLEIAMIQNTIGWCYFQKENYDLALQWCLKAAKVYATCTYVEHSKYAKVLRSEQKIKNCPIRNDTDYAEVLANLAYIYYKQNNFDLAIAYCNKSMDILAPYDDTIVYGEQPTTNVSNYEPDGHQETIVSNYEVFGHIYYKNGKNTRALEYYQKALEIYEKQVPKIPICIQRSPHMYERDKQHLQNLISIIQQQIHDE